MAQQIKVTKASINKEGSPPKFIPSLVKWKKIAPTIMAKPKPAPIHE